MVFWSIWAFAPPVLSWGAEPRRHRAGISFEHNSFPLLMPLCWREQAAGALCSARRGPGWHGGWPCLRLLTLFFLGAGAFAFGFLYSGED